MPENPEFRFAVNARGLRWGTEADSTIGAEGDFGLAGKLEASVSHHRLSLAADPGNPALHSNLGNALRAVHRLTQQMHGRRLRHRRGRRHRRRAADGGACDDERRRG